MNKLQLHILAFLASEETGYSAKELVNTLSGSSRSITTALLELKAQGFIVKEGLRLKITEKGKKALKSLEEKQ